MNEPANQLKYGDRLWSNLHQSAVKYITEDDNRQNTVKVLFDHGGEMWMNWRELELYRPKGPVYVDSQDDLDTITTDSTAPIDPEVTKTEEVVEERGKIYGDPELSHENIGLSWTGIIQQHYGIRLPHALPAWLVELMMGAFKVNRSARVYHEDNYVDFEAYVLKFAAEHQKNPSKGMVRDHD